LIALNQGFFFFRFWKSCQDGPKALGGFFFVRLFRLFQVLRHRGHKCGCRVFTQDCPQSSADTPVCGSFSFFDLG
jgi:hypothetical protein